MLEMIKPEFEGEIQAKIKSVGEIESNMKEVKSYVENLNNYYKNVTFTEETMKQAKEEKSKVNKFKKQVAEYRKNIDMEYNKPIKAFIDTAKETEKLLTETYDTINQQVANYEDKQKQEKEKEVRQYFEEYKAANNIDFTAFEQARINVTLTASMKSLKEQAKAFLDKIVDDLNLIETQEHKAEILVEYKQSLNVSQAITTVVNRFKAIEEEKRRQEEKQKHLIEDLSKSVIMPAQKNEFKVNDEFIIEPTKREITCKLKVFDNEIDKLKTFLKISNIEYESEDF